MVDFETMAARMEQMEQLLMAVGVEMPGKAAATLCDPPTDSDYDSETDSTVMATVTFAQAQQARQSRSGAGCRSTNSS